MKISFDDSLVFHYELIHSYGEIWRTAVSLPSFYPTSPMTLNERMVETLCPCFDFLYCNGNTPFWQKWPFWKWFSFLWRTNYFCFVKWHTYFITIQKKKKKKCSICINCIINMIPLYGISFSTWLVLHGGQFVLSAQICFIAVIINIVAVRRELCSFYIIH